MSLLLQTAIPYIPFLAKPNSTSINIDHFEFDPAQQQMPAQHKELNLPSLVVSSFDLYVHQRDKFILKNGKESAIIDPKQKKNMRHVSLFTLPGWGNFTFGANTLNFAQKTIGHQVNHISVSEKGPIKQRGDFTINGEATMSVTPEWIHEFKTVISRKWYRKRLVKHDKQHNDINAPERNIVMGHSKGGCLSYLLGCLRQAYRDDKLEAFVDKFTDESGKAFLKDIPYHVILEVASDLKDDIIGSIGSPLYGIQEEYAQFADSKIAFIGFNALSGNSAHYFSPDYMRKLHAMTGYKPNEVLDFVVTSEIPNVELGNLGDKLKRGAAILANFGKNPVSNTPNMILKGLNHFIAQHIRHDGIAPANYPDAFEHHIHLENVSHLEQVESVQVMRDIFQYLIEQGLLAK
ncbi:hypothetical protein BVY03_04630 [bacterium K02(2017)]|nr:hypothetical protein BVY03_04630 [bacterium K02(2017)]